MILLVGFSEGEVESIENALDCEIYSIGKDALGMEVSSIVKSPQQYAGLCDAGQRYLIVHDEPSGRLSELISAVRKVSKGRVVPATTTPTSLNWKLGDLLEELRKEDEYFMRQKGHTSTS